MIAATLLMQTLMAFQTRMFPLLGPSLAEATHAPSASIGFLVALHSAGTVWFLMAGGVWLPRLGPLRCLQVGAALGVGGLLLAVPGAWWLLVVAAIVIGIGYGPSTTAGSEVMMRYAPDRHRAFLFSLKQSGVPLGGAIAGAVLPPLVELAGWRIACAACGLVMLVITFALEPLRAPIDQHRRRDLRASPLSLFDLRSVRQPFLTLRAAPGLWSFAATGACFALAQGVLFAFFVVYAMERGGLSLLVAGLVFSSMQLAGVAGRLAAGWLADRLRMPLHVLIGLGFGSAATLCGMAMLDASWAGWQFHTLAILAGATVISWNGVFLSVLGRMAGAERTGETTAAVTFFVFIGFIAGPAAFGWAVLEGVSYSTAFIALAVVVIAGTAALASSLLPRRAAGG